MEFMEHGSEDSSEDSQDVHILTLLMVMLCFIVISLESILLDCCYSIVALGIDIRSSVH
jgi:hypothetical protein